MSSCSKAMSTECALPDWLTENYMESKLCIFYKDDQLSLIKMWAHTATGRGENFGGINSRIYLQFKLTDGSVLQRSYLLKEAYPLDALQSDIFLEYNVYAREMDMYEIVWPKMTQMLHEVGITEKLHAHALCVDREHVAIILEDLSPLNYNNADRVKKLDLKLTHLALKMMAKFHAVGFVVGKRFPELLATNFDCSLFARGFNGYSKVFTGFYKTLVRYVESQPELQSRYLTKLEQMTDNIMEYAARCNDVTEDDFQTLIHGDCWTTNIMFQYDTKGNPIKGLPIDFQFSTRSSLTMDLHFFFNTSLQEDVLDMEAELVQYYYYALKSTLDQLKYTGKLPTLDDFQKQFERRRSIGLLAMSLQPMMTYEGTNFSGFSDFYEDKPEAVFFQDALYAREEVQHVIAKRLHIFDAKGLLGAQ